MESEAGGRAPWFAKKPPAATDHRRSPLANRRPVGRELLPLGRPSMEVQAFPRGVFRYARDSEQNKTQPGLEEDSKIDDQKGNCSKYRSVCQCHGFLQPLRKAEECYEGLKPDAERWSFS